MSSPKSTNTPGTHESFPRWKYVAPLPPPHLMESIGAKTVANFYVVGDAWAQVIANFLREDSTVLDIGCGCGRTCRFLIHSAYVKKYIGFDIIEESIRWDIEYIAPLAKGRFDFHHYDIYSKTYNPEGAIKAQHFRFPADDSTIDLAYAASLFTHLLEPDANHYLSELSRVLTEGGVAIVSIHKVPAKGLNYSGNEARIDILPDYFLQMVERAGLVLEERIGEICGQEAFLLKKGI